MAIDIKDSNIKNVMNYVSKRIEKQHLSGIDLFRAAKEQPGLVVKVSNEIFPEELGQIRKKVQKELHSKFISPDIAKVKPNKQTGRQK